MEIYCSHAPIDFHERELLENELAKDIDAIYDIDDGNYDTDNDLLSSKTELSSDLMSILQQSADVELTAELNNFFYKEEFSNCIKQDNSLLSEQSCASVRLPSWEFLLQSVSNSNHTYFQAITQDLNELQTEELVSKSGVTETMFYDTDNNNQDIQQYAQDLMSTNSVYNNVDIHQVFSLPQDQLMQNDYQKVPKIENVSSMVTKNSFTCIIPADEHIDLTISENYTQVTSLHDSRRLRCEKSMCQGNLNAGNIPKRAGLLTFPLRNSSLFGESKCENITSDQNVTKDINIEPSNKEMGQNSSRTLTNMAICGWFDTIDSQINVLISGSIELEERQNMASEEQLQRDLEATRKQFILAQIVIEFEHSERLQRQKSQQEMQEEDRKSKFIEDHYRKIQEMEKNAKILQRKAESRELKAMSKEENDQRNEEIRRRNRQLERERRMLRELQLQEIARMFSEDVATHNIRKSEKLMKMQLERKQIEIEDALSMQTREIENYLLEQYKRCLAREINSMSLEDIAGHKYRTCDIRENEIMRMGEEDFFGLKLRHVLYQEKLKMEKLCREGNIMGAEDVLASNLRHCVQVESIISNKRLMCEEEVKLKEDDLAYQWHNNLLVLALTLRKETEERLIMKTADIESKLYSLIWSKLENMVQKIVRSENILSLQCCWNRWWQLTRFHKDDQSSSTSYQSEIWDGLQLQDISNTDDLEKRKSAALAIEAWWGRLQSKLAMQTYRAQSAAMLVQSVYRGFSIRRRLTAALEIARRDGEFYSHALEEFEHINLDDIIQLPPELDDEWGNLSHSSARNKCTVDKEQCGSTIQGAITFQFDAQEDDRQLHLPHPLHDNNHSNIIHHKVKEIEKDKVKDTKEIEQLAQTAWWKRMRLAKQKKINADLKKKQLDPIYRVKKLLGRSNRNLSHDRTSNVNTIEKDQCTGQKEQTRFMAHQGPVIHGQKQEKPSNTVTWTTSTIPKKSKNKALSLVDQLRKKTAEAR